MDFLKYDSPLSQILMKIADVIILNIVYLFCCIPIFTIGAAQAGMYTAAKVMLDKEDDTSLTQAFFRGFKAGFGTITVSWLIVSLVLMLFVWVGVASYMLGASVWPLIIGMAIFIVYQCTLTAFHSKFGSSLPQLMRNTFFFILGYPIQCVINAVLLWLPLLLMAVRVLDLYTMLAFTPIWGMFYYSTAMIFGYVVLRKPFDTLVSEYNSGNAEISEANSDAE